MQIINKNTISKKSTIIIILTYSTNYKYIQVAMFCAEGNVLIHFNLWSNR